MRNRTLDLRQLWGYGWCITLAPRSPQSALRTMGVQEIEPLPADLASAFAGRDPRNGPPVLLAAAPVDDVWSIIAECEASTGWVGMHSDVLSSLASPGRLACTAFSDPNQLQVKFCEDASQPCGIEPRTNRRWGPYSQRAIESLRLVGFPDGYATEEEPVPEPDREAVGALLVMRAITGIQLRHEHLTGRWIGGLSSKTAP
ncbi:hypothetical protein [Streptomyces acidicola]|uniref:Uncharacterized protein n=1 Tax=Streptomyces acidicola TaxID=2596892 RepID=A0A5N8X106_9ACTN|nr:hypothetical protein [Streptomyces acidicola]MPY52982.1 hypothetical protein [Streptomyces acidicola]